MGEKNRESLIQYISLSQYTLIIQLNNYVFTVDDYLF